MGERHQMKKLAAPASFLKESGLLYRINREILHPLGYSIALKESVEQEVDEFCVFDYDNSAADYEYSDMTKCEEKYKKFKSSVGNKKMSFQVKLKGYVIQPILTSTSDDDKDVN